MWVEPRFWFIKIHVNAFRVLVDSLINSFQIVNITLEGYKYNLCIHKSGQSSFYIPLIFCAYKKIPRRFLPIIMKEYIYQHLGVSTGRIERKSQLDPTIHWQVGLGWRVVIFFSSFFLSPLLLPKRSDIMDLNSIN